MNIRSIIAGIAVLLLSPLHAGPILKLGEAPMQINQCPITVTQNALDFALTGPGYFVVSQGINQEQLFTRYGRMRLDVSGYIVNDSNHYLLRINKKSDYNHLSKIKISYKNMAPKATKALRIEVNLPADALRNNSYNTNSIIYDALSGQHHFMIKFLKLDNNIWEVQAFADDIYLNQGKAFFNNAGTLIKQEGLNHIQWPASYGMNELKIDLKNSTQYATSFSILSSRQDGYPLGLLTGLEVNNHGEVLLRYTNGQIKQLAGRIAVAKFTNPQYLEPVMDHMYRPGERSGDPMIHWLNGEYSVISGALEDVTCLL